MHKLITYSCGVVYRCTARNGGTSFATKIKIKKRKIMSDMKIKTTRNQSRYQSWFSFSSLSFLHSKIFRVEGQTAWLLLHGHLMQIEWLQVPNTYFLSNISLLGDVRCLIYSYRLFINDRFFRFTQRLNSLSTPWLCMEGSVSII